ncbi:MAG: substrate-binding domain-containing protein [Alphaproteobacteria bacterium]|jgi:ABC-type sugar transport system substrate-binding protein
MFKKLIIFISAFFTLTIFSFSASSEEYVMVGFYNEHPVFIPDHHFFHEHGKKLGVKTRVVGPPDGNVPQMITALEQVIASKPAGIILLGVNESLNVLVDEAMNQGIPVVTWDSDIPTSRRITHVGTNWAQLGDKLAEAAFKASGGKGKAAMVGLVGASHMEAAFANFRAWMEANAPDMEVLPVFDDEAVVAKAHSVTAALIQKHPDVAVIAGFDGSSGGGICPAVREAGKSGTIKVVMNDILPAHMECLKEGTAQYIVGQKRHIFGPIALQTLYDINHSGISFTERDGELGIYPAPDKVDTGFLVVTQDNFEDMDAMVKNLEKL